MFHHLLVPLDGSPRAERALAVAARLARANNGRVTLVRVVPVSIDNAVHLLLSQAYFQSMTDTYLSQATHYLDQVAQFPVLEGIPVEKQALFGSVADTILWVVESADIDLIVTCSHGYTGITRWVLGSVAEKIVHYAHIPVLILREEGPIPASPHPDGTQPFCVLVPLDGSTNSKAAIEPAAELIAALAAPAKAKLHLMRVVASPTAQAKELEREEREHRLHRAKIYLETTVQHIREGLVAPIVKEFDLTTSWSVAVDTDVAGAIIRTAENGENIGGASVFGPCDLIAIATHGRGGLQRWAMGSVAERVLHATKLPILIVHSTESNSGAAESTQVATSV